MRVLPIWAKKPKNKKEVIATSKGWVVKETGEVLSSHKGLDEKLKELFKEIEELSIVEDTQTESPEVLEDEEESPEQSQDKQEKSEDQKVSEVVTPKTPVRRGRPKKNATKR